MQTISYGPRRPSSTPPHDLPKKTAPTGTAEPISSSVPDIEGVQVTMDSNNTGYVRISDSSVSLADAKPLFRNNVEFFRTRDPANLYCISDQPGQSFFIRASYR